MKQWIHKKNHEGIVLEKGFMETLPGTVKYYFNEFEVAILIVYWKQYISFLQDMFKDVQYTF